MSIEIYKFFYLAFSSTNRSKGMEFIFPFIKDKSAWPYEKDIYIWEEWPARPSSLLFAGMAFQNQEYIDTYFNFPANPNHPEVIRNLPVRHPVIWLLNEPQNENRNLICGIYVNSFKFTEP